ncbi:MAG: glycosyltransferase family 4 protein [Pseudomonadota bacterium]
MSGNEWYQAPSLQPPGRSSDDLKEVGVIAPNYGLEHVSYLLKPPGYRHVLLRRIPFHRLERRGTFWDKTPVLLRAPVPLVHTFNHVPMNGPPFVVSFESELPFYLGPQRAWQHRIGHALLASERCRAILSFSDWAADLARKKFHDAGLPEISGKIAIFRGAVVPSQTPDRRIFDPPATWSEKTPLRLIFVGGDGLRKGIAPLLDAVAILRAKGANIELTVVSAMVPRSYAVAEGGVSAESLCQKMTEAPWVTHHRFLSYADVREAMSRHHMLVLPTLDETLGWVVIEAAMEGLSCVASTSYALPELVDDGRTGRLIPLPVTGTRRWTGLWAQDRLAALQEAYDILRNGLVDSLSELLNAPSLIAQRGLAAKLKLEQLYHPDAASRQLSAIYDRAL